MRSRLRDRPDLWLPAVFVLKDIAAWIYVFSFEPGITERAVRIHHFLLIPGVFYSVQGAMVINVAFAFLLGFAIRRAAKVHLPISLAVIVLTWNFLVTGILDFTSDDTAGVHRLYRIGTMPGRFVSHLLFAHGVLGAGQILYTIMLVFNVLAALFITLIYRRTRRLLGTTTHRTEP